MEKRKFCLALDLKDNPELIEEYKKYHAPGNVWQEILASIKESGVEQSEIYLTGDRMFMILTVNESFSFEEKARMDEENPKVQDWEELMWKFQKALPGSKPGEKWILMDKVFDLSEH